MYNSQQNLDYRDIIKSENYDEEQLKQLTEPSTEFAFEQIQKLVKMHPRIKELEETKTKLISENRVQAEQNLDQKDNYQNLNAGFILSRYLFFRLLFSCDYPSSFATIFKISLNVFEKVHEL